VPSTEGKRIQCVAGETACPPEDIGGPHAYFDFLAAIRDPTHEEYHTPLEWIGGSFDPVAFSADDINERLSFIKA
jgi:hypothetical protein